MTRLFHRFLKRIFWLLTKRRIDLGNFVFTGRYVLPNPSSFDKKQQDWLFDIYSGILSNKSGAVIDIGANTGQTLFKILSIDRTRPYFGFEPQMFPSSFLQHFLVENKLTNCKILPVALMNRTGVLSIKVRGQNYDSLSSSVASLVKGFRPDSFYSDDRLIYAANGDEVIDQLNINEIALIKIDVEGAEIEVLEGLEKSITKHHPFVLFEVLPNYLIMTGENLDPDTIELRNRRLAKLEENLRSRQYSIYHVLSKEKLQKIEKIIPADRGRITATDYIAVPLKEEESFCKWMSKSRIII